MILPYSTIINGSPTYFVEKILKGMLNEYEKTVHEKYIGTVGHLYDAGDFLNYMYVDDFLAKVDSVNPKLHTVREDSKERWKVGTKIDFFINVRQPNMYRFAPVLPVVSTQKIEFIWKENTENHTCLGTKFDRICTIKIDDRFYGDAYLFNGSVVSSSYTIPTFANNDGFDTPDELFAYFNKNFKGKIIHWTDLRY